MNTNYWLDSLLAKIIHSHHYHITCQQLSSGMLNVLVCHCSVLLVCLFICFRTSENRKYLLQLPSGKIHAYYHMSNHGLGACGGGGWTLVMKIDGHKVSLVGNCSLIIDSKHTQHIPQGTKFNILKILKTLLFLSRIYMGITRKEVSKESNKTKQ